MRYLATTFVIIFCFWVTGYSTATNAATRQEPWVSDNQPGDVPRTEIVELTTAPAQYSLTQNGTLDGEMCRSPTIYGQWSQVWESNRSIRMENIGTTDIINPWLTTGRANFRTLSDLVNAIAPPEMTDRKKAFTLWNWHRQNRFHYPSGYFPPYHYQMYAPLKVINLYGYDYCEYAAVELTALWQTAGLPVRWTDVHQHSCREVFFDGRWNVMDSDLHVFFPLIDNFTLASEPDLIEDHDLVKRIKLARTGPNRSSAEWHAAIHVEAIQNNLPTIRDHAMDLLLRPGESLIWEWGHILPHKFHGNTTNIAWNPATLALIGNGEWEYTPPLNTDICINGMAWHSNIAQDSDGLATEPGQTGTVIWEMKSPYVMVGGDLAVVGSNISFSFSYNGSVWEPTTAELDSFFPSNGPAVHTYYLACNLETNGRLNELTVRNDLQMAPLSLPAMQLGENTFYYSDHNSGDRNVRITHKWVERSSSSPPFAPAAPVFPENNADVEGTRITFEWLPASDPDDDPIVDYHFVLSDRPDIPWPLSPNFEIQTTFTTNNGSPYYTLEYNGMLNPDQTYFWYVRAKDSLGVWGPWSDTWHFTPRAPGPPLNVQITMTDDGKGFLQWEPNTIGREPCSYRVYGSDEKGFSISDDPYNILVSSSSTGNYWATYPANFTVETTGTCLQVVGPTLTFPNANKAHYRVVAVDSNSNRSGPSTQASAPRPFIIGSTNITVEAGESFFSQYQCISSWGHFRSLSWSAVWFGFWDLEMPVFSLQDTRDWLTIDSETGLLEGTPPSAAPRMITINAEITGLGIATQTLALSITPADIPTAPSDFSALPNQQTNSIKLSWTHSTHAEEYEIRQGLSDDFASSIITGNTTKNTFTVSDLNLNTLYYYWLIAGNVLGTSEPVSLSSFWQTLLPPAEVQASFARFTDKIRVFWQASENASGYVIYRAGPIADDAQTEPEDFSLIGTSDTPGFDDFSAIIGKRYLFRVVATNSYGTSELGDIVEGRRRNALASQSSSRDFDGDGMADFAIYHELSGLWGIFTSTGQFSAFSWGGPGFTPVAGDFDGDGCCDPAVYHEASGTWYVKSASETPLFWGLAWGGPGLKPVSGDFDGDGKSDFALYSEAYGLWYILSSQGDVLAWSQSWGGPGLKPVSGDFDGDGKSDFALYAEAYGLWFILSSQGDVLAWAQSWGGPGLTPAPGDYDGDGKTDLVVYDQENGLWYARNLEGRALVWARGVDAPGCMAVSGDYDGDGCSDFAAYDPVSGQWLIRSSKDDSLITDVVFGGVGFVPVQ